MKITADQLRNLYLDFFKSKGHAVISGASLIPENDPTVLFTTAGMHPLVPYLMGERTPHLDPDARGVFFGLSAMHTKRDMLRAVMEGVAYSLRDCMEVLKEMGVTIDDMYACGGGGSSPLWRQMLADTFNCPVKTVASKEGPALGVAILAGVGTGVFKSVQEGCDNLIKTNPAQHPDAQNVPKYEKVYQVYRKIYPALKETYKELAKL